LFWVGIVVEPYISSGSIGDFDGLFGSGRFEEEEADLKRR